MSTTPSALSAGLQALSNAGLLPTNLTTQQLESTSPAELTKIAIGNIESGGISSLFGDAASSGDSVNLSDNLTAELMGLSTTSSGGNTDPILQALEAAATSSNNALGITGAASTTATPNLTDTASTAVGSLFSYLG